MEGTFNEATFDREYNSNWGGDVESAFFKSEVFDKNRVLNLPEYSPSGKNNSKTYYLLGIDVGRFGLIVGSSKTFLIAGTSLMI